jgi:hypothetical protein
MMATVVNRIADLVGVEVQHISGSCIGLCQPIDVGIGKPLKSKIRHKWEEWIMLDKVGIDNVVLHLPMHCQLSQWIIDSLQQLSLGTIQNSSWTLGEYSFSHTTAILEEEDKAQAVAKTMLQLKRRMMPAQFLKKKKRKRRL